MPGDKPRPRAISKKQRKLMGMAQAIKEGTMPPGKSPRAAKVAQTMDSVDLRSMAETKEGELPETKKPKTRTKRKPATMASTLERIKKNRRR